MTAYTDFHYSPTGSGVISGSQVLEQTEQGINGLGQYVQDNISGAIDTANQALTIAQTANTNATTALNTANSFSDAITTANQTANNALTTAQSAQSTANSASSLATTANNNANTALNAANTATSNVATLTSSVNALGNRMTTAENAISTNAGNITTLQTNLQTTNNNVTAAANAASSAQATATSAQSTATLARNQAYVLRYTGTTITGGGTIAYADIDNTDNIKARDKIIDVTGVIYAIASVDTANQTVTVGASPVINLFCDAENLIPAATDTYDLGSSSYQWNKIYSADVVHTSGDETITGIKTLVDYWRLQARNLKAGEGETYGRTGYSVIYTDKDGVTMGDVTLFKNANAARTFIRIRGGDYYTNGAPAAAGTLVQSALMVGTNVSGKKIIECDSDIVYPTTNNATDLGTSTAKWKTLNGVNPGALSLPTTDSTKWVDLSGNLTAASSASTYTPAVDGWISVMLKRTEDATAVFLMQGNIKASCFSKTGLVGESAFAASACIPVRAGISVGIHLKGPGATINSAYFMPCQGNV